MSERDHADLFWAIRGGGGNFGIVTSFEFRLHPVGPEVLAGLIVSSRASDPQSAQQIAGLIILPVIALMIGQLLGVVQLSLWLVIAAAVVLLAIDAALLAFAVRVFQRETILTRWK